MSYCTASCVYVAGEKISLRSYAVLRRTRDGWVRVMHWREMPEDAEMVLVVPLGVEHEPELFTHATWDALGDQRTAKGAAGRRGTHKWDPEHLTAVAVTRAHGVAVSAPGSAHMRSVLIELLESEAAAEDLAKACVASNDPILSSLALASVVLSREQVRSFSKSQDEALRSRAARYSNEPHVLARLLSDPHPVVRQTAARNPSTPQAALSKVSADPDISFEIASNHATPSEVALDFLETGGIEARAAITNPGVAERAERALRTGSKLDVFAARNPAVAPSAVLKRAATSPAVAHAAAFNAPLVERMNQKEVLELVNILLSSREYEGIASVCRHATLSPEVQEQLLTRHYSEPVMLGLAGSKHLSPTAAELILDSAHLGAVVIPALSERVQHLLSENPRTPGKVLAALDHSIPSVARNLSSSDSVSSTIRSEARQFLRSTEAHSLARMSEALSKPGVPITMPRRVLSDPLSSRRQSRTLACILLSEEALDRSLRVQESWGLHAWGGKRIEIESSVRIFDEEQFFDTRVVLRVDDKQASATANTNINVDPLAVVVENGSAVHFAMLSPAKEVRARLPEFSDEAVEIKDIPVPSLFEAMAESVARIDKGTVAKRALAELPVVGKHVGKARLLAQVHKNLSGVVDGTDRVAHIPVGVSAGSMLRVVEADIKAEDVFTEASAFVRSLYTTSRISAEEQDAVSIALSRIEQRLKSDDTDKRFALMYRDMLRFRAGQVHVVEKLLQEDLDWLI